MKGATSFGYKVGEYYGQKVKDKKEDLLTDENLRKAEYEYLLALGLKKDEFEIRKVVVDKKSNLFINTIIVHKKETKTSSSASSTQKPSIVLIHGYGGTGLMFSSLITALARNFRVILVDLIGNGSSSRPKWDIVDGFDADLFFSKILENWREAMELTDFYLVGTSYGGYIAGCYASFYPKHIRKLVLCGPVGLAQKPLNFGKVARHEKWDEMPYLLKVLKGKTWGRIRP